MPLISKWKFNGDDGADTEGVNPLTLVGSPASVLDSPVLGQPRCIEFNGSTSRAYRTSATVSAVAGPHSVGGWVKYPALVNTFYAMFAETGAADYTSFRRMNNNWASRAEESGVSTGVRSNVLVVANVWVHIVHTSDGSGSTKIYINGVEAGDGGPNTAASSGTDGEIVFGARTSTGVSPARVRMSNWFLYNEELTANEILGIYTVDVEGSSGGGPFKSILGDGVQ